MRILGDKEKSYDVEWDSERKRLTCTCPDYKYIRDNKIGGTCKHIRKALKGMSRHEKRRIVQETQRQVGPVKESAYVGVPEMDIETILDPAMFAQLQFHFLSKTAGEKEREKEPISTKMLKLVDKVRPYAYRGAMGAVPGAVLGNAIAGKGGARTGALIGGAVGVSDKALENLSKKRKFSKILKTYKEESKK